MEILKKLPKRIVTALWRARLAIAFIAGSLPGTMLPSFGQNITDLGSLGPSSCPFANGINSSGQVVGSSTCPSPANGRAFLFSGGTLTVLPTLYPDPNNPGQYLGYAQAYGINGSGQVTGISDLPFPQGSNISPSHAFLYSGGTMIDIDAGDAGSSFGRAINDVGQVAGIIGWGSATQHAALFSAGTVTDLGTLGGQMSAAIGINNQGQIVGWSQISGHSAHHAFVWQNGAMVDITPSLPVGENSEAYAVNGKGQIVGIQQFPSGTHAAFWLNGQVTDLGTLGGPSSEAWGINSSGWIVGDSNGRAFLYRDGTMTDLNSLLPPNSGWNLTIALAINDHGQIAGSGFHNGAFRPFLLALNSCQVDDARHSLGVANPIGLVNYFIGTNGVLISPSAPGIGQQMIAHFAPTTGDLVTAAANCSFIGFDWQQTVDVLPAPSPFKAAKPYLLSSANISSNQSLQAGGQSQAPPFSDPPPGGYSEPLPLSLLPDSAPFYYLVQDSTLPPGPCAYADPATYRCDSPPYFFTVSLDLKTLSFYDLPGDPCLPGDGRTPPNVVTQQDRVAAGCSNGIPNSFIAFTTSLVGVTQDQQSSGVCSVSAVQNCSGVPLYTWRWKTTYNGTSGGIYPLYNNLPPDPGSGTGGITIIDINGVPQTPPSVSCTATPSTLWPPNGKSVLVTVSGSVAAGTQTIAAGGTTFAVTDKYGRDQPTGSIAIGADGSYSFTLPLIAARNGGDLDGRRYAINIFATDAIGNVGSCEALVVVPHDQGH